MPELDQPREREESGGNGTLEAPAAPTPSAAGQQHSVQSASQVRGGGGGQAPQGLSRFLDIIPLQTLHSGRTTLRYQFRHVIKGNFVLFSTF